MIIQQVLNNNVVIALDENGNQIVVVGSGIGYYRKKGDGIQEDKIRKIFTCESNRTKELVMSVSPEIIELVNDINAKSKKENNFEMEDEALLVLADHINFALKRISEGLELSNPFLEEIQILFQNEYRIGVYAQDRIHSLKGILIPEAEVAYIAMHLISAKYHQEKNVLSRNFEVIDISLNYINQNYLKDVNKDSLAYNRLVNHLKFFAERYLTNKESEKKDSLLNDTLRETFIEETECINGLAKVLKKKFGIPVTESEMNYIIIHLRNCRNFN